jgi:hypothetical protein
MPDQLDGFTPIGVPIFCTASQGNVDGNLVPLTRKRQEKRHSHPVFEFPRALSCNHSLVVRESPR